MEVFASIDPDASSSWPRPSGSTRTTCCPGCSRHRGPILTVANWSGTWPGLVGMLNLNGSLTKAGMKYSTLWSEDFTDEFFTDDLRQVARDGRGQAPDQARHAAEEGRSSRRPKRKLGEALAAQLAREKAIMGIFDEGCMGMYNAIIPDELLNPMGVFKERLSQSALYYETTQVSDDEARAVRKWMEERGMKFVTGPNEATDLTDDQILTQCKMYIAAVRIADDFGCDLIGIQYQQGLKDLLPASDLVEGTLNNADRPPVKSRDGKRVLYEGEPLPHFNEVDECAGLDGLMTYRVHKAMGQPVENTLHDVRWGDWDQSGTVDGLRLGVPDQRLGPAGPFHRRLEGRIQRAAAGACTSASAAARSRASRKPGEIVWSRIFVEDGKLKMDLGRAGVVELPAEGNRAPLEADHARSGRSCTP